MSSPDDERLQRLASQHHSSAYSRAKFGINGSPVRYVPLSLQLPDHFAQLRSRQLTNARRRAWWPAPHNAPPDTMTSPSVTIQDQIMAAISEPLQINSQTHLKTSLTHPISISYIIPVDLIDLVSSHALLSNSRSAPTLLEIPPSFTLDRLSALRDRRLQTQALQSLPPPPSFFPSQVKQTPQSHFRTRSHVSDALHAAINSGLDYGQDARPIAGPSANHFVTEFSPEPSVSVSLSMSTPTLPQGLVFSDSYSPVLSSLPLPLPSFTPPLFKPTIFSNNSIFRPPTRDPSIFTLGNLLLSSCPGKKVRLDGPVKGRSGVRRDVETDMRRMKELGVGCIVCCLDDEELDFLGAPWPEYEMCAHRIGLDVLRLPIPEGLPPTSAPCLDTHLTELINRYTMQGVPILVHCRGGVGRAGVVACCWMIRVGLCGWLTDNNAPGAEGDAYSHAHGASRRDVITFVEKVITLIRRRRSIKALETYEQVKFVVEYVEHLQREADASQRVLSPDTHAATM